MSSMFRLPKLLARVTRTEKAAALLPRIAQGNILDDQSRRIWASFAIEEITTWLPSTTCGSRWKK